MPHVTHDGAKIYWEETGAGEPMLLIHGLGATLDWWERLMPAPDLLVFPCSGLEKARCGLSRSSKNRSC